MVRAKKSTSNPLFGGFGALEHPLDAPPVELSQADELVTLHCTLPGFDFGNRRPPDAEVVGYLLLCQTSLFAGETQTFGECGARGHVGP